MGNGRGAITPLGDSLVALWVSIDKNIARWGQMYVSLYV